jgi:membrane peptidoglycan carboxypeptidase
MAQHGSMIRLMLSLWLLSGAVWPLALQAQNAPSAAQIRGHYDTTFAGLEPLPDLVYRAFMVAEDRNFDHHPLVNSTLTRWIARGMLPPGAPHSAHFATASTVAHALTRAEVLNAFAQGAYLGLGCYGARNAALAYFGQPITDLDIAQIALLAILPKAPIPFHPARHPDRATARRNWLLQEMARAGTIPPAQARQAEAEPLGLRSPLGRCDE